MEALLKSGIYVGFFLLFCSPGLPLGLWLCGRDVKRHPEAVVYGLLLGHFLSSGLATGLIYLFGFSLWSLGLFIGLAVVWLMVSLAYLSGRGVRRDRRGSFGKLSFKAWNGQTYALFLALLLVAAALTFEPLANLGKKTPSGYAYRKYFTGDFLKQVAITAELSRGELPPQNPWFTGETLHYYWGYFILPTSFHRLIGLNFSIKNLIVLSILLTDVFFLFMLFSTLRLFTTGQVAPFLAVLVGITSYSYEGVYLWWELPGPFVSFLEQARAYNMDAVTRWLWGEPQMDGLFRSLLYSPQHLQALTLLLAVIAIFTLGNVLRSFSLSLVTGLMVGVSVGYSVFVGLFIALWYGLCLGIQLLGFLTGRFITAPPPTTPGAPRGTLPLNNWSPMEAQSRGVPRQYLSSFLLSGCLAGFLVVLYYSLGMFVSDPDTGLMIYTGRALKTYGPLVFLMNYGPPSIFGILGLLLIWKKRGSASAGLPSSPLLYLFLLLFLAVTVVCTVALKGFLSDVSLKLGLVILISLLFFSAIFLEFLERKWPRPAFYLLLSLIAGPALLTVLIDRDHLADIYNEKFTLYVSEEDMQAATWIKTHLPDRAIVQSSSPEFEVTPFTLIPVLGERRTAVGDKFYARIFQVPQSAVNRRKKDIARLFETDSLAEAMEVLKKYQINYLYLGEWEKETYPFGVQKFYSFPRLFEKVYENPRVDLFKVLSYEPELITLEIEAPIALRAGEDPTAHVLLKNQDPLNIHTVSVRTEVMPEVEAQDPLSAVPAEAGPLSGHPVVLQLVQKEEKWIPVPLPAIDRPGTYTLVVQVVQESIRHTFRVEAESVKGHLGKIQDDPEASEGKAVFIGAESVSPGTWAFLLDPKFPPGDYILNLRVKTRDNRLPDKIFTWEVVATRGGKRERWEVSGTDFQQANVYQSLNMSFHLTGEDTLKFRIRYHGGVDIWIDEILLTFNREPSRPSITRKVYPSGVQVD